MRQTLLIIAARWGAMSTADALPWILVTPLLVLVFAESFGPLAGMLALALLVAKLFGAFLAWLDRGKPGEPPPSSDKRRKKKPPGGGSGPSGGAPVFANLRPRPVLGAAAAKELPMGDEG